MSRPTRAILATLLALNIVFAAQQRVALADGSLDKRSCTFHGHKLYGKIQVVKSLPDVKIQIVKAFPDVKVQVVKAFPDQCGKWQMVSSFPDTKVQFVTSFPDVKIQYVKAFPGM